MCNGCANLKRKLGKKLVVKRIYHMHPGSNFRKLKSNSEDTYLYYSKEFHTLKVFTYSVDCYKTWFGNTLENRFTLLIENCIGKIEYEALTQK